MPIPPSSRDRPETITRIVLLVQAQPRRAWRLALRLEQEAPGAKVAGLLYQTPRSRARSRGDRIRAALGFLLDRALHWAQASPPNPSPAAKFTVDDLARRCGEAGWPLLVTDDPASSSAHAFVRERNADLGVVRAEGALGEELLLLPRRGSLVAQALPSAGEETKPPREGGRPSAELRIEVVRVGKKGAPKPVVSRSVTAEPFDTTSSLRLKADLIMNDLLVQSVAALGGKAVPVPLGVSAFPARSSADPQPPAQHRQPGVDSPRPRMWHSTILLAPYWIARNWWRRLRGRFPLVILFHHLVCDRPHHLGMSTDAFLRAVRFLQRHYAVLSLTEATELLASGSVKTPTVVLTFDDGYGENFLTIRAVMEETGVPVTFFLNPELIDRQLPFSHDLREGETGFLPFTWEQVEYLASTGAEIGSHTRSHFDCGSRDRAALREEIVGSKEDLERRLRRPVPFFAFPWGHAENMSAEAIEVARSVHSQLLAAQGGGNWPERPDPSGILCRLFLSPSLWELQFRLQSVGDLASSFLRTVSTYRRRLAAVPEARPQEHDA